jgi:SAM-dependent methyltransferase
MPSSPSDQELREFYELYGARLAREGRTPNCSQPTITQAVIEMARKYLVFPCRVIDVGCGANLIYDRWLAERGAQIACVDFTFNFLTFAPRNFSLVQADAASLPFPNGAFDAAICSETLEHIPRDDLAVGEIARVLRPGGLLIATVPTLWNAARLIEMIKTRNFQVVLAEGHLREYTPRMLRNLLAPWFEVQAWMPVTFGWSGRFGGPVDALVRCGILKRVSKSLAWVARRRAN